MTEQVRTSAGRFLVGGLMQVAGWDHVAAHNAVGDVELEAREAELDRVSRHIPTIGGDFVVDSTWIECSCGWEWDDKLKVDWSEHLAEGYENG